MIILVFLPIKVIYDGENSLAVQWLGLCIVTAQGLGLAVCVWGGVMVVVGAEDPGRTLVSLG